VDIRLVWANCCSDRNSRYPDFLLHHAQALVEFLTRQALPVIDERRAGTQDEETLLLEEAVTEGRFKLFWGILGRGAMDWAMRCRAHMPIESSSYLTFDFGLSRPGYYSLEVCGRRCSGHPWVQNSGTFHFAVHTLNFHKGFQGQQSCFKPRL
jgi:hypothetical protein